MKEKAVYFPGRTENPLTYRTLLYVVLCSAVFALISTAIQLFVEYKRDVSGIYSNISLIEKSYLVPLSASVYKIDTEGLRLQLQGALKLPGIVHLEVKEQRGENIVHVAEGALSAKNLIRREYELVYSDTASVQRKIGDLTVSATLDEVHNRLVSRIFTVLTTNTIKTFFSSACILMIIYYFITRHLLYIGEYTRNLIPGKNNDDLVLNRKVFIKNKQDEIDQVVYAINLLQRRVYEDFDRFQNSENQLKITEQKYKTVADFTYDWEYWSGADDSFLYISPSCKRISGYDPQDFMDDSSLLKKIIVPEDRVIWDRHVDVARENRQSGAIHFRIRRKEGEVRWIEHNCQPVTDHLGNSMGIRAGNRDITDRKLAEIKLCNAYADIQNLKNQLEAETSYLQAEIKLEHNFENIVGNSPALKYVLYKVEQVADSQATVLVLGESGTGKELIARAIHSRSSRGRRPLMKVNCATLPSHLIESELFGHERGAYTGAQERRLGRFEVANGTSIFLDEIGELPLELQAKLLRVLQEGEFERLGSTITLRTDVRVIAATNRDLEEEVRAGRFRKDLFYRLNVFPITVPPLRQRPEDIPLLARYFVEKASKRLSRSIEQIPESAIQKLQAYTWPGNIRELINVIDRAVIYSSGNKLQLSEELTEHKQGNGRLALKSMQDMERDHILQVLKFTEWRIEGAKGAARILDMNPSTLRSRMRKLNIRKA